MSSLHIHLFGKFCVRRDGQVLDGIDAGKVRELFCYLLLHRHHPHTREALASLLWGDTSTAQSKKYLRQALWQLQAILEMAMAAIADQVLLVEGDWIRFNPHADLWLDVAVFEQVFALVQRIPGQDLDAQGAEALQGAVQLYQGELLAGWYQPWCLYERERLQTIFFSMLDKLMEYCGARAFYEAGLEYGMRILRYDRAHERTYQQIMRLYYLAGDRTMALRQYERCTAVLQEELGVQPSERTVQIYEQIRADRLADLPSAPHAPPPLSPVATDLLLETLQLLIHLETVLADLQLQIRQNIQVMEVILAGARVKGS
jgi:DNA-binding SARP family transcriptional activator